jgi:hypothetical protein
LAAGVLFCRDWLYDVRHLRIADAEKLSLTPQYLCLLSMGIRCGTNTVGLKRLTPALTVQRRPGSLCFLEKTACLANNSRSRVFFVNCTDTPLSAFGIAQALPSHC